MRSIDKAFLSLFKNIRIVENPEGGYTAFTTNNKQSISNSEVVGLVKQYQDEIISTMLLKED